MFAAEVTTNDGSLLPVDWRRSRAGLSWRAVDLEPSLSQKIHRLHQRLGLRFGCVDAMSTADGEIVFLEINPSGQWYWVEMRTGQPMLEAMVDALAMGRGWN